jgi:hypothetical protein
MCDAKNNMAAQASQETKKMPDYESQVDKSSKSYFGYPKREPTKDESDWFKKNQKVGGRAVFEDGTIILNPYSKLSDVEKDSVAKNEGLRLWMNNNDVTPNIKITDEQKNAFVGTEYGKKGNEKFLKQTIISRIVSGDPSSLATEEQKKEAERIIKMTEQKQGKKDKYGYNGQPDEPLEPNTFVEENVLGVKAINMGADMAKRGYKAGKEFYNKSKMNK